MNVISRSMVVLFAGLALAGCQRGDSGDAGHDEATSKAPETVEPRVSAGKPTAPVSFEYRIIGTPVVGQPVSIDIDVSSTMRNRPVTLNYRINDARNLAFPEAQAQRVALASFGDDDRMTQQVTVVPQREGRLYLNVYAEVETEEGTLMKSIAIPIQVGRAPGQPESNGEPRQTPDGETVISLPAEETSRQESAR